MFRQATGKCSLEQTVANIRQHPEFVPLAQASHKLVFSIVLAEDTLFFQHSGVRLASMRAALMLNLRKRRIIAGGSTITQQLAKNLFFTFDRRYSRKVAELFAVRQIEQQLSKDEILETYMNCIYYGCGHYGIADACWAYFGTPPKALTLGQALMIAAILPAPNRYNPKQSFEMARLCQQKLVTRLFRRGLICVEDAKQIYDTGELTEKQKNDQYDAIYGDLLNHMHQQRAGLPELEPEQSQTLMAESLNILPRHTAAGLVSFAQMCLTFKTCYMLGGLGQRVTSDFIARKREQYPDHYSDDRVEYLSGLVNQDVRGFDCSGLVKAYYFNGLHRLSFDPERDKNSLALLEEAVVKGAIETIPEYPGICVYLPGHIGIYIGEGRVIESTINPAFGDGVVMTRLDQRKWTHWFQCRFIEY